MKAPGDSAVEWIEADGVTLAVIIRREFEPDATRFITAPEHLQQIGFVKYPQGGTIVPHLHKPLERHIVGTPETLIVRSGRAEVSLYDEGQRLVAQRILETGDVLVLIAGGHGFRLLEDTIFLEVKQGPYTGLVEKERF
jgi:hypothetical protein